jgi:hypothetical protein
MDDKVKLTQNTEEGAWIRIMDTTTQDVKETFKELLNDILSKENDNVKKAIMKHHFKSGYKTLHLNAANPHPQVQEEEQEEEKQPRQVSQQQEEINLEFLLKGIEVKEQMLGKRSKPESERGNQGQNKPRTLKEELLRRAQGGGRTK